MLQDSTSSFRPNSMVGSHYPAIILPYNGLHAHLSAMWHENHPMVRRLGTFCGSRRDFGLRLKSDKRQSLRRTNESTASEIIEVLSGAL